MSEPTFAHRLGRAHHGRRVTRHTALACWRGRQGEAAWLSQILVQ